MLYFWAMAKRNKLGKFADLLRYPNVLENFDHGDDVLTWNDHTQVNPKGEWSKKIFENDQPITLELACGKGEYAVGMAQMYPERNFIGVDIKGARIWKGATKAVEEEIKNVAFLRTRIEMLHRFFAAGEIEEIWITFADPFLKTRKGNRRLTARRFLDMYHQLLQPGGSVNLKTDSCILYYYTIDQLIRHEDLELIYKHNHIYSEDLAYPELEIKTFYEASHLRDGRKIKFVKFKFKS